MTVVENKTKPNPAAESSLGIRSFSTHPIQLCNKRACDVSSLKSVIVAE